MCDSIILLSGDDDDVCEDDDGELDNVIVVDKLPVVPAEKLDGGA